MMRRKRLLAIFATSIMTICAACTGTETLKDSKQEIKTEESTEQNRKQAENNETEENAETESTNIDAEVSEVDGDLTVTFLDVGQGNAVLIQNDGQSMLVDGGDRDQSSFVVSYLKQQGIEELTYVVSSHYDADHLNGVVGALNAFTCDEVLSADYETDTRVYQSFWSTIEEKDIPQIYPEIEENYELGDAYFTIVCPDSYDYSNDNDNSIGIRLVYGETSFLICGDASSEVEEMMLASGEELDSDVYLASHHGSEYSSSTAFLQAVSPEAVVVSCGKDNSYGHPAKAAMERIQATKASLYRTDLQGTIMVTSDGISLNWNTEACNDFRSGDEISGETGDNSDTDVTGNESSSVSDGAYTDGSEETYVLNTNTKKFHKPSCGSVNQMNEENKANFTGDRQELIDAGYQPCKNCNP